MPVHHFVAVAEDECSVCPECKYAVFPPSMRGWTETQAIMSVIQRRASVADARILLGSYLVANEDLIPSSQRLQERTEDLLAAARLAGWRPRDEEEERTMPVPMDNRREQLAQQYAKTYNVSIERARHAVLNNYTAAPQPVNPESARVEALAKATAQEYGLSLDEAIMKTLQDDPKLRAAYLGLPVFPSAFVELTIDQMRDRLSRTDIIELAVERKLLPDDRNARQWIYDWVVEVAGRPFGSFAAADELEAMWNEVILTRVKRHGTQLPPGR